MSEPIFEIKDLAFSYNTTPILHQINATIAKNEFIAIFGPNGGGKTTFLQLLMGFLKPSKGSISLLGKSPTEKRDNIGYVPQILNFDLQFPITVEELVMMGSLSKLTWYGTYPPSIKKHAHETLALVGLENEKKQLFGTLSGGQRQRALIARALIDNPTILLLDEPTASVDIEAEEAIYKLLKQLNKEMTILMVTHDLDAMTGDVNRLFCIHRGLTEYTPEKVCEHFAEGLYHKPLIKKTDD